MPRTAGAYPINWGTYNIRPVGDPGDPMLETARTLSALMASQARMARAAGGGGGGKKNAESGIQLMRDADGKLVEVNVPGSTKEERKKNAELMQEEINRQAVDKRFAPVAQKFAGWENMSNAKKAQLLAEAKAQKASLMRDMTPAQQKRFDSLLEPYEASQKAELETIEKDKGGWSLFGRRAWDATADVLQSAAAAWNDWQGDTQAADQHRRDIAERQQAMMREPYMREQALREAEGEGFFSRLGGETGGLGSAIGSAAGMLAPQGAAVLGATLATAPFGGGGGAAAATGLARLANIARTWGPSMAIGGGINAAAGLGITNARIMGEEGMPMEQRLEAAREASPRAALIHGGIGALPVGVGTAGAQMLRAGAARRAASQAAAERVASGALTQEAADAAANVVARGATARTFGNLATDTFWGTAEQMAANIADVAAQNLNVGSVVNRDVPVTEGMGAALLASLPFGMVTGASMWRQRARMGTQSAPETLAARATLGLSDAKTPDAANPWALHAKRYASELNTYVSRESAAGVTPETLYDAVSNVISRERGANNNLPDITPEQFVNLAQGVAGKANFLNTDTGKNVVAGVAGIASQRAAASQSASASQTGGTAQPTVVSAPQAPAGAAPFMATPDTFLATNGGQPVIRSTVQAGDPVGATPIAPTLTDPFLRWYEQQPTPEVAAGIQRKDTRPGGFPYGYTPQDGTITTPSPTTASADGTGTGQAPNAGQADAAATAANVASNTGRNSPVAPTPEGGGGVPDATGVAGADGNTGGNQGARAGEQPVPGARPPEADNVDAQAPGVVAPDGADGGSGVSPESAAVPPTGAGERGETGAGVRGAGDAGTEPATSAGAEVDPVARASRELADATAAVNASEDFSSLRQNIGRVLPMLNGPDAVLASSYAGPTHINNLFDFIDSAIARADTLLMQRKIDAKSNRKLVKDLNNARHNAKLTLGKLFDFVSSASDVAEGLNSGKTLRGNPFIKAATSSETALRNVESWLNYLSVHGADLNGMPSAKISHAAEWLRTNKQSPLAAELSFINTPARAELLRQARQTPDGVFNRANVFDALQAARVETAPLPASDNAFALASWVKNNLVGKFVSPTQRNAIMNLLQGLAIRSRTGQREVPQTGRYIDAEIQRLRRELIEDTNMVVAASLEPNWLDLGNPQFPTANAVRRYDTVEKQMALRQWLTDIVNNPPNESMLRGANWLMNSPDTPFPMFRAKTEHDAFLRRKAVNPDAEQSNVRTDDVAAAERVDKPLC